LVLVQTIALALVLARLVLPGWVLAQGSAPTANPVLSLAVAPAAPNIVLAGTLNSPEPPGIYRSTDGAASWSRVNSGLVENISIAGWPLTRWIRNSYWPVMAVLAIYFAAATVVKVGKRRPASASF
jgi:hypothetical protein